MNKDRKYTSAFANAHQDRLPTVGMLPRDEAKPSGQLPTILETTRVGHLTHQSSGCYRPNPRNLFQALAERTVTVPLIGLRFEFAHFLIKRCKAYIESPHQMKKHTRQPFRRLINATHQLISHGTDSLRQHDAKLGKQSPYLVRLCWSRHDEALSNPVH